MRKITMMLLIMMMAVSSVFAQEDETFTTGDFTITIPAGWVVQEEEGQILIASVEASIGNVTPGEASVTVLLPESLAAFGLETEADPVVVVETVLQLISDETTVFSPVEAFESEAGYPAARAAVTDNSTFEGLLAAVSFEDGVIVIAFETSVGDLESYIETFAAMGESIYYGAMADGEIVRQWASNVTGTSQYGDDSWSFEQAAGEPNTTVCGDETTAWASESSIGSDILVLEYDQLVQPTEINIYQTYNPGSIIFVEVADSTLEDAETYVLENSTDAPGNTDCPGVFTIEITEEMPPINTVLIYLDQTIGGSWNEIDAVELVGVLPSEEGSTEESAFDFATEVMFAGASYDYPADWESVSRFDAWYAVSDPEGEWLIGFSDTEDAVNAIGDTPLFDDPQATMDTYANLFYPTSEASDVLIMGYEGRDIIFAEFQTPSGTTALVYIVEFSDGEYGVMDAQFSGEELTDEAFLIIDEMAFSFDQGE